MLRSTHDFDSLHNGLEDRGPQNAVNPVVACLVRFGPAAIQAGWALQEFRLIGAGGADAGVVRNNHRSMPKAGRRSCR